LNFDLCALAHEGERLRLVGNLPYNISTPLLFRFLEQADCIEDMHLMLQKEVVDRASSRIRATRPTDVSR
jgi:16S rRNA (adenine1518-N6/adenine1519-N6)-dimethyltransferase